MLAIVLALASAIGYGGSDFAAGLASRSAPVIQITLLASAVSGVFVAAALPFAASPGPSAAALAWGFTAGIGGTLGAVNSLYAIVDSRRRELATLRAIGFRPGTIVASTLCESMLLAFLGALIGAALAWVFFNGISASPFGYSFKLDVTPPLVLIGVIWALIMGLIGGILPAVRAARVSVTTALRAV